MSEGDKRKGEVIVYVLCTMCILYVYVLRVLRALRVLRGRRPACVVSFGIIYCHQLNVA